MDRASEAKGLSVFISYAPEDEQFRRKLDDHLSPLRKQGIITIWHHQNSTPGKEWQQEVKDHLNSANIILLLVSPDFIASDYCYSFEMMQAITRHERDEVRVIPIILKPVDWVGTPFSNLSQLPKGKEYIQSHNRHEQDETFARVASDIRGVINDLLESKMKKGLDNHEQKRVAHASGAPISLSKRNFLLAMGAVSLTSIVSGAIGYNVMIPTILQRFNTHSVATNIRMIFTHADLPTGVDVKKLEAALTHFFKRDFTIAFGSDYGDAIKLFASGDYNMLWATDFAYVIAYARNIGVKLLLMRQNRTPDHLKYYSHILTKKSSGINRLEDLYKKRFSLVDSYSTSGYLYPLYMLQNAHLSIDNLYLQIIRTGSHIKSLENLFDGASDACAVSNEYYKSKDGTYISEEYSSLLQINHLKDEDIRSLVPDVTYANPIPMGPIVIHQDVSDYDALSLIGAFYQLDALTLGSLGVSGFGGVTDAMYGPVRRIISQMDIDLTKY